MIDTYATAREMLADLAAKHVSARELLDAHIDRNDEIAKQINAVVETDIARAQKDATAIDDARAKGEALGALAGLPMTIKDGFDVENLPAMSGNPALKDRAKNCADATVVADTRNAGAVIWGKTNVPFMLSDIQSYNAIHGTTNNPYDVTKVPGGSSGGAAAALATGVTPLEIGSDIGGSLRHPANFCGVTALKPTWAALDAARSRPAGAGRLPRMRPRRLRPDGAQCRRPQDVVERAARHAGAETARHQGRARRDLGRRVPAGRSRAEVRDGDRRAPAMRWRRPARACRACQARYRRRQALMDTLHDHPHRRSSPLGLPEQLLRRLRRDARGRPTRRGARAVAIRRLRGDYRLRATGSPIADIAAAHRGAQQQRYKDALASLLPTERYDAILMPISTGAALSRISRNRLLQRRACSTSMARVRCPTRPFARTGFRTGDRAACPGAGGAGGPDSGRPAGRRADRRPMARRRPPVRLRRRRRGRHSAVSSRRRSKSYAPH